MENKEFLEKLEELEFTPENYYHEDGYDYEKFTEEIGDYEEVESVGGGAGEGEYVRRVLHFPKFDIYLSMTATYMSYHGTDDFEGWNVVYPKQKTITVYE